MTWNGEGLLEVGSVTVWPIRGLFVVAKRHDRDNDVVG